MDVSEIMLDYVIRYSRVKYIINLIRFESF